MGEIDGMVGTNTAAGCGPSARENEPEWNDEAAISQSALSDGNRMHKAPENKKRGRQETAETGRKKHTEHPRRALKSLSLTRCPLTQAKNALSTPAKCKITLLCSNAALPPPPPPWPAEGEVWLPQLSGRENSRR